MATSSRSVIHGLVILCLASMTAGALEGAVLAADTSWYEIGDPLLTELWVDPVNGDDGNSGAARGQALRTVAEAWRRIPQGATLTDTGYRINCVAGNYSVASDNLPLYWESKYGAYDFPIIIAAADGVGSAFFDGGMNVYDCRYLYVMDLSIHADGDFVFHGEQCDHLLLRGTTLLGTEPETYGVQEALKMNQSHYIYVERCDISGSWNVSLDFVAVEYGHILHNLIHNAGDWCLYLKGGSAYFTVAANEFYDGGTGGFSAGQGTGFEYMTSPWLHYEAYDCKFINNIVHDVAGAGTGVNGGYNILIAYNTFYHVGAISHVLEFVFGSRGCGLETSRCQERHDEGGWGPAATSSDAAPIPNRNVFVYNNIVYNPPGFQSQWQQFAVGAPEIPPAGSNIPSPAYADDDLQIRGNIIWNGPADMPLGIGEGAGCPPSNPTCNETQLRNDNAINTIQPELVDPAGGNFRPAAGGNVFSAATFAVPAFSGGDRVSPPLAPEGDLNNSVTTDFDGNARTANSPPGAFFSSAGPAAYSVTLSMPAHYFSPGDPCSLSAVIGNTGAPLVGVPLFCILELAGYWFWPQWEQDLGYGTIALATGTQTIEFISPFNWPDTGNDSMSGLVFWSAMTDRDVTVILGGQSGLAQWSFGFGPT